MTGLSVLMLGLGLGLRHAVDADHVVVVSTLLERSPGALRAAGVAALWGLGHSMAFLAVGLLVVVFGVHVPAGMETAAELLVAAMLLGFGAWHLRRSLARAAGAGDERPPPLRAVLVGLVHGLSGSAAIALLATTTIHSRAWAAAYLAVFCVGTLLGMVLVTMALSGPISWTMRRGGRVRRVAGATAALLSLALGAIVAIGCVTRGG